MVPTSGLPYPNHHKRFVVKMFTFVDQDSLLPVQQMVGTALYMARGTRLGLLSLKGLLQLIVEQLLEIFHDMLLSMQSVITAWAE